jgi:hypothetical protein
MTGIQGIGATRYARFGAHAAPGFGKNSGAGALRRLVTRVESIKTSAVIVLIAWRSHGGVGKGRIAAG